MQKLNKIIRFLKQLFCRHKYEIGIIMGMGINMSPRILATAVDGVEIVCFCPKCNKRFVTVIADSKFNLRYSNKNEVFINQHLIDELRRIKIK